MQNEELCFKQSKINGKLILKGNIKAFKKSESSEKHEGSSLHLRQWYTFFQEFVQLITGSARIRLRSSLWLNIVRLFQVGCGQLYFVAPVIMPNSDVTGSWCTHIHHWSKIRTHLVSCFAIISQYFYFPLFCLYHLD